MIFNQQFAEKYKPFNTVPITDLSVRNNRGSGLTVGGIRGKNVVDQVTALVYKGAGTAGDDIEISLKQSHSPIGLLSDATPLICSSIHSRPGASIAEDWTLEAENVSSWTSDDNAEKSMVLAIDIPMVDIIEGIPGYSIKSSVISASISQAGSAGNAQLGGCLLFVHNRASNSKFVENHDVIMAGPGDLSAGAISLAFDWDNNAPALRTLTWVGLSNDTPRGDVHPPITFEATDDANNANMPWKRLYTIELASGAEQIMDCLDNVDDANTYAGDGISGDEKIFLTDFDYIDIPGLIRNSNTNSNVNCSWSQTTKSQLGAILAISSGARHTQR